MRSNSSGVMGRSFDTRADSLANTAAITSMGSAGKCTLARQ
jgi:hypothetical protein